MAKPNYEVLLQQIAQETDPIIKAQLKAECYVFTEELTDYEKNLFNYVSVDYLQNNPDSNTYIIDPNNYPFIDNKKSPSYVGVYFYEKLDQ